MSFFRFDRFDRYAHPSRMSAINVTHFKTFLNPDTLHANQTIKTKERYEIWISMQRH